jgi:hypothetical protein
MHIGIEYHGETPLTIEFNESEELYIGTLKYRDFENGVISGSTSDAVQAQFQAIRKMLDAGGMIRGGIIMLGYHNGDYCGDVLLVDGEIIGEWTSDEFEWCHFTSIDADKVSCAAPSPWMLQDAIAIWIKRDDTAAKL